MGQTLETEGTDEGYSRQEDSKKVPMPVRKLPDEFTERFEVLEAVGKGSFGYVYKVRDTKTKAIYAAKRLEYNVSNMKEASLDNISALHLSF